MENQQVDLLMEEPNAESIDSYPIGLHVPP